MFYYVPFVEDVVFMKDLVDLEELIFKLRDEEQYILEIYDHALIRSIAMKTYWKSNSTYPTYQEMAEDSTKKSKATFICVPHNVGCTTISDLASMRLPNKSMGCPRYFFRFNFTSAIHEVPYAYVDWCSFQASRFTPTYYEGRMSNIEWTTGPSYKNGISPFVTIDVIAPSRFVLAYDGSDVAFLSIDSERLGESNDDNCFNDLGNNVIAHNKEDIRNFLKAK